jgi:hypothetical protein
MRLRVKVFDDPRTSLRYLVSIAMFEPASDTVNVFLMNDEDTRMQRMTVDEYNALPYYFFKEDGPATRPPMHVVSVR